MDYLPGTISLLDELDKKMLVVLRDGKKFVGVLRSFDQFANIVLENTVERIYLGNSFGERKIGVFLIRGENVMLLGNINEEKEEKMENETLKKVDFDTIKKLFDEDQKAKEEQMARQRKLLQDLGIEITSFSLLPESIRFDDLSLF